MAAFRDAAFQAGVEGIAAEEGEEFGLRGEVRGGGVVVAEGLEA